MQITIPPYARCTIRTSGPFSVLDADGLLIGPNTAGDRVFRYETAQEAVPVEIRADEETLISHRTETRDSFEKNSGIPVAVQEPISEPTIQEMMRMYLAQTLDRDDPNEVETPDEFFDFDTDDEQDILTSPWEYEAELMEEQYAPEDPKSTPEPDKTEPATPEPETTETSQNAPEAPQTPPTP